MCPGKSAASTGIGSASEKPNNSLIFFLYKRTQRLNILACSDLVEGLHGEVDAAAGGRQRQVLLRHRLHLSHDDICLLHLPSHLRCLLLKVLQCGDNRVVVKDATLDLIQGLQERFFQLAKAQLELTWK